MKNILSRLLNRGRFMSGQWLTTKQVNILAAVASGASLRSHRDLEGNKRYELLFTSGKKESVTLHVIESLRHKRLIETNHKFPSATYLLTGHGAEVASKLRDNQETKPLTARKFAEHD